MTQASHLTSNYLLSLSFRSKHRPQTQAGGGEQVGFGCRPKSLCPPLISGVALANHYASVSSVTKGGQWSLPQQLPPGFTQSRVSTGHMRHSTHMAPGICRSHHRPTLQIRARGLGGSGRGVTCPAPLSWQVARPGLTPRQSGAWFQSG